ncbi:dolichol kinase [Halopiger thermotolerans]
MADELKRRLVHASGSGLVALYLLADALELGLTWAWFRILMVVLALGALVLEFVRLRFGLDWRLYEVLTREYEEDNPAGYALYLISMAAVVVVFPPKIALPAMLMLTLGDPISGTVSDNRLQRVKGPRVLVTMFVVSALFAAPFLAESPLAVAAAAFGATVADGVTLEIRTYIIDDNLTIPVYAAGLAWLALEFGPA